MKSIRQIRAFATELTKIAANLQDAEVQALFTERKGEEYLKGGRLESNSFEDLYIKESSPKFNSSVGLSATDNFNLKARTKKDNSYQTVRDYTTTGVKGGLTGLGMMGAFNAMRKRPGSGPQDIHRAIKHSRRAAALGSSAAIVDRAYRHDDILSKDKEKSANFVNPKEDGLIRSPAMELAEARQTGRFRPGIIHDSGKSPKPLQLGTRFKFPQGLS